MKTSNEGIKILHHFEGLRLEAYPDPATGGAPWTIGWGHTGPEVVPGLKWTRQQADQAFVDRLAKEFEPGVKKALTLEPSQSQFDAMVCLAYNIGVRAFSTSTLTRHFNAGSIDDAAEQFLRWDKAAGKSMLGLRRRRAAERARFLGTTADEAIAIAAQTK